MIYIKVDKQEMKITDLSHIQLKIKFFQITELFLH